MHNEQMLLWSSFALLSMRCQQVEDSFSSGNWMPADRPAPTRRHQAVRDSRRAQAVALAVALAAAVIAVLLVLPGRAFGSEAQVTTATRAIEPPVLDGEFDDACWVNAAPVTGFIENAPENGAAPSFPVDLRIAVDADAIYLAFRARTGDPDKLVTSVMQRDGPILSNDDYFIFGLDTFHDHRDCYYFMVNAAGAQNDGRIADEGVTIDGNWDGTWQVATQIHDDGWSAEIALPLRNFSFRETEDGTWGFVAFVSSRADQRYVRWPAGTSGGTRVSGYGDLAGLTELDGRKPTVVLPYLTNGSSLPHTSVDDDALRPIAASWERAIGLDLRVQPTSTTSLSLTLNPDFAAVEADQFVFNLTTDELWLPERRPFFVEGTDLFSTPSRLLYTRRIGVDEEIVAGGKLLGRSGANTSWGVLSATTGNGLDAAHQFTAARLKHGILGSSSVGLLLVSKDRLRGGPASLNRAAGVDLNWQVSRTSRVVVTHSRSQRPGESDGSQTSVDARYNSNLGRRHWVFARGSVESVSAGYDLDDIGFIGSSRIDRRGVEGRLRYGYQPSGFLREIAVESDAWLFDAHDGSRRVQDGAAVEFSARTAPRISPSLSVARSYFLDRDDDTAYHNTERTLAVKFGPYARVGGELNWRTGRNFGPEIRYLSGKLTAKAADNVSVTGQLLHLHRSDEKNDDVIGVGGLDWRLSSTLYARVLLQADTGDDRGLASALLRWDFAPGSTLYLSFRESRLDREDRLVTEDRTVLGKVSWRVGG